MFNHRQDITGIGREFKFDFIHELAHQEQASPARLKLFNRRPEVWLEDAVRIKGTSLIPQDDLQIVVGDLAAALNITLVLAGIRVFNNVGTSLIHSQFNRIDSRFIETRLSSRLYNKLADFLQAFEPGREFGSGHLLLNSASG
jgi:hypothetical protein